MKTFQELGLEEELLSAIGELGFETPTPIQEKAIPVLLTGVKDFVGLAQTGTGKTAAFGLPLLQLINEKEKYPQALIVCPTRELCIQIYNDLKEFKKFKKSIFCEAVYGGTSISMQIQSLKKGVQIVIATPGRLIDLINRKAINLNKVEYVVLDEADEMLNMGFRDDIDFVLENTPNREAVWLFSATMPDEVRNIANNFMHEPAEITIGKKNMANVNIDHQYFIVAAHHRYDALKRLIDFNPDIYGIIFTRTKAGAQDISERLSREGYALEALHGDLSQQQRDRVMKRFRSKSLQMLVATDVAARGIDVEGITHVINYELPDDPEVYTHRSGRTGRAGNKGICFSICHSKEIYRIREIEKLIKTTIQKMDIPDAEDVISNKILHYANQLLRIPSEETTTKNYPEALFELFKDISKEDLLKKILNSQLRTFLESYEGAEDLNIRRKIQENDFGKSRNEKRFTHSKNGAFKRFFINLGTKDGFHKGNFLEFILNESHLKKAVIGKIDMREVNSWVEVDAKSAASMAKTLNGKKFKGRTIRMNEAEGGRR